MKIRILPLISLLLLSACSGGDDKKPQALKQAADNKIEVSSALNRLPDGTFGFAHVDVDGAAMNKFLASPWGSGGDSSFFSQVKNQVDSGPDKVISEVLKVFEDGGFDLSNPKSWQDRVADLVLFAASENDGGKKLGAYLTPGKVSTSETFDLIKEAVAKNPKMVTAAVEIEGAKAISIKNPNGEGFVLAATDSVMAAAQDIETVSAVLSSNRGSLPASIDKEKVLKATSSRFGAQQVISSVYADAKGLESEKGNPLEEFAMVYAMAEGPGFDASLKYTDEAVKEVPQLAGLTGSSSEGVFSAVPEKPLFAFSIDGAAIKSALAASKQGDAAIEAFSSLVDSVDRLAFSAKNSGGMVAFFPVPDILISVQSSDSTSLRNTLKQFAQKGLQDSGMPALPWQVKDASGVEVHSMDSGMGVGMHLAAKDNLVLVASNFEHLSNSLKTLSGDQSSLDKTLSGSQSSDFGLDKSLLNLRVDFAQVANYLESSAGSLKTYVSPEDLETLAGKEALDQMRQQGIFALNMQHKPGTLSFQGGYSK